MALSSKPTAQATRDRRWRLFGLSMATYSSSDLAQILGVSRRTITSDLRWLRNHARELAIEMDSSTEIAVAAEELQRLKSEAVESARQATSFRDRAALLRVATDALVRRVEMLSSSGFIERTPLTIDLGLSPQDFRHLSSEALIEHRRRLLERIRELLPQVTGDFQSAPRALP